MLTAGIGGAVATWGSMCWMYLDLQPQPPEVLGSLIALGGVLAGLCGGIASLGRGHERDRIHPLPVDVGPAEPGNYNPIALLKKLGCGSVLLGCVLPLLAFFGNSPVISWISLAAVSVGVLVYAGAFFADVSETLSNQAMQRVRNTIGPDEESNVTSR
jgi:hypothetical protein